MTQRIVHRPARTVSPLVVPPSRSLAAPPAVGSGNVAGLPLQALLPLVGALSSMTMMLVLRNNPVMVLVALVVLVVALVSGLGMALSQRGNAIRARHDQRERYLDHLETLRTELRATERSARAEAHTVHPAPEALLDVVRDPARLWERRRSDPDFLEVRVGIGDVPRDGVTMPPADGPAEPPDPMLLAEARGVAERHSALRHVPVPVPLDRVGDVAVVGERAHVLGVVHTMLAQVSALHAPDDVQVALVAAPDRLPDWRGVDLLPHLTDDAAFDGPAAVRRVAPDLAGLHRLLAADLRSRATAAAEAQRRTADERARGRRLLVVVDGWGGTAQPLALPDGAPGLAELGVTVVHLLSDRLHEPSDTALRITARPGNAKDAVELTVEDLRDRRTTRAEPLRVTADAPAAAVLRGLAHALAPLRLSASSADGAPAAARAARAGELLGIADVTRLDVPTLWRPRSPDDFLRVPIGTDDDGAPVLLDLKESAQQGMGPHGLCIGATGSGKSELLRTLVASLATSHSPQDLAMILVDYKGGAAFAPFAGLPHVAGILDNLADDAGLTERARASFSGEVLRRQQVLRDAGSPSITHYRELRRGRPELPELPHLLLVIDEFGELLTAEPEFVDLLLMIGRIGRSIGVHLLLSSQRIEAGRLRGLETYLSYRIGLRTFSEAESSMVLDTPDAFHLPAMPGFGYLKVDTSVYQRFRAGYVSGPAEQAGPAPEPDDVLRRPLLLGPYNDIRRANGIESAGADPGRAEVVRPSVERPVVDVIVDQLGRAAAPARPVWLDPLPARVTLGDVLGRTRVPTSDELARGAGRDRRLAVPIGLLDEPARQRQEVWRLDLTRAGGHVVALGAPQSGRTTFLWSVAAGIALTHTPQEVAVYGMDLTGGGLARIDGFPQVGGVATRSRRDRLARLLEELLGMLAERERVFARYGIDSLAMLRVRHAAGELPELPAADVVLLLDGLGLLRQDFEELEEGFGELLQRGGGFGIHVVAATARWNDLRTAQQNLIGTKVELRLNDPADSTIARKLNATIRPTQAGRVLTDESLFGQVALPLLGADDDPAQAPGAEAGDAVTALARQSALAWAGPSAPPIRMLPDDLAFDDLPDPLDEPDRLPFGLRQDTMGAALLDLDGPDQHLLVLGDAGSGRSTVLRTLVTALVERHSAAELSLAVYDVRGSVADACPDDEYLGGTATSSVRAVQLSAAVAVELERRTQALGDAPRGTGVDGPRIVVVVDDEDILSSGGTDPLRPLLPYLPAARDLRLHVLLARPVAGASRALYDPVLQTLRDTGASGFVLSGERAEGQLFPGVRAEHLPPGRGRWVRRGERPVLVQVGRVTGTTADAGPTSGRSDRVS
ncbi:type VII secretion protein EccCa [Promicromonospora sp. NPDC057488]|uniref:type VII secretion protein EccCa n=1 Tax=Promicromonospora sp. NPDC057488 TaxID=3346147 RepID=UPI00366BED98